MDWQRRTRIFIIVALVAIFLYDVIAMVRGGDEAAISFQVVLWSYQYPAFTFISGFIMGHLFWRIKDKPQTKDLGQL
jgi:hypothetical protein